MTIYSLLIYLSIPLSGRGHRDRAATSADRILERWRIYLRLRRLRQAKSRESQLMTSYYTDLCYYIVSQ